MRLVELRALLRKNCPLLSVSQSSAGGNNTKVSGFRAAIKAAEEIAFAGVFTELATGIADHEGFRLVRDDVVIVPQKSAVQFQQLVSQLSVKARTLLDALDEFIADHSEPSVAFRLPDTGDLGATGDLLRRLEKLLEQALVNDHLAGRVRLLAFDRGSAWIEISLGATLALRFFGAMVRFYYESKERQVKHMAKVHALRDLELQVELREQLVAAVGAAIDSENAAAFDALFAEHDLPTDDHEYRARVKHSLEALGKCFLDGLEVHPSLQSKTEAVDLLPNPVKLLDLIRQLPGGSDEDGQQPIDEGENPVESD